MEREDSPRNTDIAIEHSQVFTILTRQNGVCSFSFLGKRRFILLGLSFSEIGDLLGSSRGSSWPGLCEGNVTRPRRSTSNVIPIAPRLNSTVPRPRLCRLQSAQTVASHVPIWDDSVLQRAQRIGPAGESLARNVHRTVSKRSGNSFPQPGQRRLLSAFMGLTVLRLQPGRRKAHGSPR